MFTLLGAWKDNKIEQAEELTDTFINIISQPTYCFLIWMFTTKRALEKIHTIHNRNLEAVYNKSMKNYSFIIKLSIHQSHIRLLAIEVLESGNRMNPQSLCNNFCLKEKHVSRKISGINATGERQNALYKLLLT